MHRGHSVKIILNEPGEYPQLGKGFYVPVGFAAYVSVKKKKVSMDKLTIILSDSFFYSDDQPELNLENDYLNKAGSNLKTNSSISIL